MRYLKVLLQSLIINKGLKPSHENIKTLLVDPTLLKIAADIISTEMNMSECLTVDILL